MKNWILGILFALGLSVDWGCNPPMEMRPDGQPHWEFVSPQVRQASADAYVKSVEDFRDDGVLYLTAPDPDVQDILFSVADYFMERYQVQIAVVSSGGRPVTLGDLQYEEVEDNGEESTVQVAGNAHVDGSWCAASECSNPAHNVGITLDAALWQENGYSLDWLILAHEVGHIVSGWGACYAGVADPTGSHVGAAKHVMSPVTAWNADWDEMDDELLCSCGACDELPSVDN